MRPDSLAWINRWSREKYPRLYPDFYVYGYGTDSEPETSHWMATLLDPLGECFCEGVKILDYGCGCARLFNFITGHLQNFTYYGAEPAGGKELAIAKSYFENDSRAVFMTCEEAVRSKNTMSCDAVILGSVFTHLLEEKCESILQSLWPVINNGGMIIFSALLSPVARAERPGAHGFDDCYGISYLREGWIKDLEKRFLRKIEAVDRFKNEAHRIFRIQ